jgi:hypothetical protein
LARPVGLSAMMRPFEALRRQIDPTLTDQVRSNFMRELMIELFLQHFETH